MDKILEEWIEHDYNPFILFDKEGKVVFLNAEAQFLLGFANKKDIFELALTYASGGYGFKTTIINVEYGRYSFFAITVGYKNDETIGIKLYKKPNRSFILDEKTDTKANIYSLIDLCISSLSTKNSINHQKILDPTFPDIYIKVDSFLKLLIKIYNSFIEADIITTKLYLKTGEHIVYADKKYSIIQLQVSSDTESKGDNALLMSLADEANVVLEIKNRSFDIELPLIDSI